MLKIPKNLLKNLVMPIGMAKEYEVKGKGVFDFKLIFVLLISMIKIANSLENLLTSMDIVEENKMEK